MDCTIEVTFPHFDNRDETMEPRADLDVAQNNEVIDNGGDVCQRRLRLLAVPA